MADLLPVLLAAPRSPAAAAFRLLRLRIARAGDPRLILLACPHADDGAAECAVNLAIAIAEQGGARVLVIDTAGDADGLGGRLRDSLARPGVGRAVAQRGQRLQIHATSAPPPLRVDIARLLRADGHALLDAAGFARALRGLLATDYDYLVVAAPPVLDSTDSNFLADMADAIVLTARAGRTRLGALQQATARLAPREILGVALIGR